MTMRKERQMHFATRAAMAAALAGAILGSGIKLGAAEEPGKQVEPSGPPGVKLSLFGPSLSLGSDRFSSLFGVRPILSLWGLSLSISLGSHLFGVTSLWGQTDLEFSRSISCLFGVIVSLVSLGSDRFWSLWGHGLFGVRPI
jgi:hypothetical protein